MTKKGKGKPKTAKRLQENASTEEDKSSIKKLSGEKTSVGEDKISLNKPANEIDEIFAGKKRKKPMAEKIEQTNDDSNSKPKRMKQKKQDKWFKDEDPANSSSRPRKRTQDGLTIYTEEELGYNKADAGGTPLCPFDCSCCF